LGAKEVHMRSMSPLLAALLGAAVVGVVWFLAPADGPLGEGAPSGDMAPVVLGAGDQTEVLARLDGIERRLDALGKAVNAAPVRLSEGPALEGRAPPSAGDDAPVAPATSDQPLAVSDDALERVVERLEKKKQEQRFAKMSTEQMLAEARRLRDRQRDMNGAREVLEHLLTRDLENEERAKALLDLGAVHRGTQEYEQSERRLREAMRVAGDDSETGVQAGYQLIWTFSRAKQPERGLAMADHLLKSRGTTEQFRPWMRWAAARMAMDSGDKARARTDYRALLEDFKGKAAYKAILSDAARSLKELE
jgi:tetratricopeptide (TPR) repeat protein